MDKKRITIVTGTGGILGTGHIQRMLNLALHLNRNNNFSALIYLSQNEHPTEEKFSGLITPFIPAETDLIIRDMRDSTIEEMDSLRRIAPVLAIDDSGSGRRLADFIINLLPVPVTDGITVKPETELFLYGFNFTQGISLIKNKSSFIKDIDVTIYTGYNPPTELISLIRESIPSSAVTVLLKEGKAENFQGDILKEETPYSEIIYRSKIVITHFGLTMFEAHICGCKIAALNPTKYHNELTETVNDDFAVIYSEEYSQLNPPDLKKTITAELLTGFSRIHSADDILKKIDKGINNFSDFLDNITNKR